MRDIVLGTHQRSVSNGRQTLIHDIADLTFNALIRYRIWIEEGCVTTIGQAWIGERRVARLDIIYVGIDIQTFSSIDQTCLIIGRLCWGWNHRNGWIASFLLKTIAKRRDDEPFCILCIDRKIRLDEVIYRHIRKVRLI